MNDRPLLNLAACAIIANFVFMAEGAENGAHELVEMYSSEARMHLPTNCITIACTVSNGTARIQRFEYFNAFVNAVRWHRYGETFSSQHTYLSTFAMVRSPIPESYGIVLNPGQQFKRLLSVCP